MSKATHRVRGVVVPLAFSLLFNSAGFAAQAPQGEPLGTVNAAGEVSLDNMPVPGQSTIYTGETVRTGADGTAQVSVSGSGLFMLASQSRMSFPALPRYLAVLEQGSVGLRSIEGAKNLRLRVRDFIVLPDPSQGATAQVEFAADGSVHITCLSGSVGVTQFDGPAALFLNGGETAIVTANGILLRGGPQAQATTETPTPPTPQARRKRTGMYLLLGLAGGGAAGAAAALASHGHPTTSPSTP